MARVDGTVLFGQRYLKKWLAWPEQPEVAVTAVCAHEFGHILQYKLRLESILRAGQPTEKRLELHADYLAGYYAGTLKLKKPGYPAAVFATQKYSSGDWNVNSPTHHGTPDERAAAIVRGFEVAHRERHNLSDAIQIGINYVSML
jgi:predicted metalloprotease